MPLASKLKAKGTKINNRSTLWLGPHDESEMGGLTYSMLAKFISCRERFRIHYVLGLRPKPQFHQRMEYGNLWHAMEEALAGNKDWKAALKKYTTGLCDVYRLEQKQVVHWSRVAECAFPAYVKYWSKHKDVKARKPVVQEHVFDVPYALPSGRSVRLRGKWDALDVIGAGKTGRLWLQENKARGDIDEMKTATQLRDDLQSMMYFSTVTYYVRHYAGKDTTIPKQFGDPAGIRYNVARRPLSGGLHSIKQKQTESEEEFYTRLAGLIADNPDHYFARWNVEVLPSDLRNWEQRTFIPLLENVCNWWEHMLATDFDPYGDKINESVGKYDRSTHWQHPHGCYNSLDEAGHSDLDEYLATGSTVGLQRTDKLFTELQE